MRYNFERVDDWVISCVYESQTVLMGINAINAIVITGGRYPMQFVNPKNSENKKYLANIILFNSVAESMYLQEALMFACQYRSNPIGTVV